MLLTLRQQKKKIKEKLRYTVDEEDELIPNHDQQTIFAFGWGVFVMCEAMWCKNSCFI